MSRSKNVISIAKLGHEAESDRLRCENAYLLSRMIQMDADLKVVLDDIREVLLVCRGPEIIKLLKALDIAEKFQCSEDRVYALIREKALPVVMLGPHQYRFDPVAIRRWLDSGGRETIEENP